MLTLLRMADYDDETILIIYENMREILMFVTVRRIENRDVLKGYSIKVSYETVVINICVNTK